MLDFKKYIDELQSIPIDELTEHSKRSALESILKQAARLNQTRQVFVLQEPKRKDNYGSPDFKIFTDNSIIGYVENKKITESLDKIIKSEQITKYRELSQNLLITNYIEFVWLKGELVQRETLCYLSDIENKKFKIDNEKAEKVEKLLLNFFSQAPEKISLPKDLALALAVRCRNLKDYIYDELTRQNEQYEQERLYDLYNAFKHNIFSELTISEFSDAFAQMLAYGLFLAGINAVPNRISLRDTKYYIPASFQLIKELLNFLDELEKPEYMETKWIIDEIIAIINNIHWYDLKQNLSFNKKVKDNDDIETDPFIYFYETFLATYDHNLRKAKGVYYTPPQVVNFIVRAIDDILVSTFDLPDGLAERNKVTVLDFATGTGTFLLEVFKNVLGKVPTDSTEKRQMLIQDHILKNLYGFEYLIAPYTIAHLKLSQFLKESDYDFSETDRLQVYLTNTLEPVAQQVRVPFMPQLSRETQSAQAIKDKPILVITGNPPYSGNSKNKGEWILNEIKNYKFVDGKPLGEKNSKWLQDDYVKFIRFAQDKMDKSEQGIVGIITNHSFLDNPTFRGMRQSLMNTFDLMYFIDLHGNSSKKETTPEGDKDDNIFDIKQGVCISIFIKKKGLKKGIFHTDFWGARTDKFNLCTNNSLKTIEFTELHPNSPFYFFIPKDETYQKKYDSGWKIQDIFDLNVSGIVTARDNLCIHFNKNELEQAIRNFKNLKVSDKSIEAKYSVKDNYQWKIDVQRRKNSLKEIDESIITDILYRPFDVRKIYYDDEIVFRPRNNVMKHFQKENIGLVTVRQVAEGIFNHAFVTNLISNFRVTLSNKGGAYIFPLYRYNGNCNGNSESYLFKEDDKKDNFTEEFRNYIKTKYRAKAVDKKEIASIKKTIKEQENQLLQVEKIILSLQKSQSENEMINIQLQFAAELKRQLEQKKSELQAKSNSQGNNYEPSPNDIFNYIYAILHSPTFRKKYAEFLKMDFPKIPFTDDLNTFTNLSELGRQLVALHLLKKDALQKTASVAIWKGAGDNVVIKPHFVNNKLYINKTQYIDPVPAEVYHFQIGGYQVLDKYIKDRKDRTLTLDEVESIENIIKSLTFTIKQMELIDSEVKDWI